MKDLDKGHSFYSDDAVKKWKRRLKDLEKAEKDLVKENRKAYREYQKRKKEKSDEDIGQDD